MIPSASPIATTSTEPLSYEDGQYKYVWKTKKSMTGCGTLTLSFIDETSQTIDFVLN